MTDRQILDTVCGCMFLNLILFAISLFTLLAGGQLVCLPETSKKPGVSTLPWI